MKRITGHFAAAGVLLALSGCAALDQTMKDVNAGLKKATAPATITESLPEICQAAKDNQVKANNLYVNKGLSINGEVKSIKEGFQPRYRVYMRSDKIGIHAGTENKANVESLSTGKTVKAFGIVTDVTNDYSGCSISLKDATFS